MSASRTRHDLPPDFFRVAFEKKKQKILIFGFCGTVWYHFEGEMVPYGTIFLLKRAFFDHFQKTIPSKKPMNPPFYQIFHTKIYFYKNFV